MRLGIGLGLFKSGLISAGVRIFSAFQTRVIGDGGTVEAGTCVVNTINSSALLQQASLLLIPSGYKGGKLYAEIPTNGNGDFTWARTSTANRTNSSGNIELMGANVPRLSYMYGSCPAVLLEPQRTNSILQSETFDNVVWTAVDSTITANAEISPSGATNAETMTITSSTSRVSQNIALGAGTFQVSVYVKVISQTTAGTLRLVGVVDGTNVNSNFTPTNQWQRVVATYTPLVGITNLAIRGNASAFVGTIAIWGFQCEQGAYLTTYIPTTSATATRVADSFSRDNIYTNGLISASGGTWFVELRNTIAYARDGSGYALFISTASNGFGGDGFIIYNGSASSIRPVLVKFVGGSASLVYSFTTDNVKLAIKWNGSTADVFANGIKVVSATSYTGTLMQYIGNGIQPYPLFIQQMALIPEPKSDQFCIDLTTL